MDQKSHSMTLADTSGQNEASDIAANEYKFVEISKLPKRINAKTLTSLIVSSSKVVPKSAKLCYKTNNSTEMELVALVEFDSEIDAMRSIERMNIGPFGKTWRFKLMSDPKFTNPESEMLKKWLI